MAGGRSSSSHKLRRVTAQVRCPICDQPRGRPPYGPFCSERCRVIDLDRWLSGRYRIAAEPLPSAVGPGAVSSGDDDEPR